MYYRQLKYEGIKFPERDVNERTMMENLDGINSPMFDFVEQKANMKVNSPIPTPEKSPAKQEGEADGEDADEEEKISSKSSEMEEIELKLKTLNDLQDYVEQTEKFKEEIDLQKGTFTLTSLL